MAFFVFGNRNLKKKRYKRIHVFVTTFLKQVFISLHDALNKLKVWKTNRMLGTIVHVMHRRIEQRLFPLLRIQCVGYGFIISLASPWQPRYQRERKKNKRVGREKKELTVDGKKRAIQSGVFLFPVRVNRRLCAALP